jgi:hypothetical protein
MRGRRRRGGRGGVEDVKGNAVVKFAGAKKWIHSKMEERKMDALEGHTFQPRSYAM